MTVLVITDCPAGLKGDISRWLFEINTGVFVGNISARVRQALWDRICECIKSGRATMVFRSNGEQHMRFWVHNTTWTPIDYDGITLMRKPLPKKRESHDGDLSSKRTYSNKYRFRQKKKTNLDNYVVLDIETTGLSVRQDEIIQLGGVKINDGKQTEVFSAFVQINQNIPEEITALTGISDRKLLNEGIGLKDALEQLMTFVGENPVLAYNAQFDIAFIQNACKKVAVPIRRWKVFDVMMMARSRLSGLPDYKLVTVANQLDLGLVQKHQALEDALLTWHVYTKLKEMDVDDR